VPQSGIGGYSPMPTSMRIAAQRRSWGPVSDGSPTLSAEGADEVRWDRFRA
jgi:hypothetical protein